MHQEHSSSPQLHVSPVRALCYLWLLGVLMIVVTLFHLTVQAIYGTERSLVGITLELDGGMVDMILLAEHSV